MKYHFLKLFLIFFTASAIHAGPYDQLAEDLLLNISNKDMAKVFSIAPFIAKGTKSGIDDEATANILNAMKKFKIHIAERGNLSDLLKEIELSQKGLGKKEIDFDDFSNASITIIGMVHSFENGSKKVFIKAVDVKTSLILSTAEITIGEIEDTFLLNLLMDDAQVNFYNSFANKIHFSFLIGSGWQSSFAAPVDTLNTVYLTGPPLLYWFRFGYPVSDQMILFLHLGNSNVFNPFLSASNNIVRDNRLNKVTISLIDAGAGFAWYFRPSRFFFTAAVGDASALYKNTSEKIDVNFGFGLNAAIGYRHKVSRSFGIGYMLGLYYSHLEFSDINVTIPTRQGYVNDNTFNIDTFTVYLGAFISLN